MPAKSAGSDDKRSVLPWGQCCSRTSPNWLPSLPAPSPSQRRTKALEALLVNSTATQTMDDGRWLHHWRSIHKQYWLELQKVQYSIQSTLNKRRDPGRTPSDSHFGTGEGAHPQHRSGHTCSEQELQGGVGAFLPGGSVEVRAQKEAPSATEEGEAKQACSDTIEETISLTDEAVERKHAWFFKGS